MTTGVKSWEQVKVDQQARRIIDLSTVVWLVMQRTDTYHANTDKWIHGEDLVIRWYLRQRDAEAEIERLRREVGDSIQQRARQEKKAKGSKEQFHSVVHLFREATFGQVMDLSEALDIAMQMIEEWCERRERLIALQSEYAKD